MNQSGINRASNSSKIERGSAPRFTGSPETGQSDHAYDEQRDSSEWSSDSMNKSSGILTRGLVLLGLMIALGCARETESGVGLSGSSSPQATRARAATANIKNFFIITNSILFIIR